MKIAEWFHSIQGEGKLAGLPSTFIRTSGCNLRCTWCDTPYASWDPQGHERSIDEIMTFIRRAGCPQVVLTGGEPLIQRELPDLCHALSAERYHVTLETAGTLYKSLPLSLLSLSPKLSNSTPHDREGGRFARVHDEKRLDFQAMQRLIESAPEIQLKFVVASEADLPEIEAILEKLGGWQPQDVLLMPEGTDTHTLDQRARWLAELCKKTGYRFCPRLHVALYGNTPGT